MVLPEPATCGEAGIVSFGAVGGYATRFATDISVHLTPSTTGLEAIRLDGDGPVLLGVPPDASMAADAGSTFGAYVEAPTVTAGDSCDGASAVALLVTYPDASTATDWPADGMFPIGTTTLEWSSSDTLGNPSSETRSVVVANHHLLDVSVVFSGSLPGTSTRALRVKAGVTTQVVSVSLTNGSGTVSGIELPVLAARTCVSVKDAVHSLTKTAAPSIVGTRFAASVLLKQGDSNDDDIVDIFDYGIFLSDRGFGKATNARSNFNNDTAVNNADFGFIGLNFFRTGESCTGAFDGPEPRTRVSVKELRRRGLGHLAVADRNRDGWVDIRDVRLAQALMPSIGSGN